MKLSINIFNTSLLLKKQKGFTFIELILVVSIMLTVSIFASSFYSRFLTQNAVETTTDHIISQMRKAQIYSMSGKQSANAWGVKYVSSPAKQMTLYLTGNSGFDENYLVNGNITISPVFDIAFAHFTGVPSGASFPLTITISGNNKSNTLTINSQGVISKN